jgi:repressor LexA
MDMNIFAVRLKAIRTERNVSARELAEAVGVNKATIHHYERAEFKSIKTPTLMAIAEYLQVNPDYLIGASDSKHTIKDAEADITDDEKMLLELFRRVPVESQQMVLDMIRVALSRGQ